MWPVFVVLGVAVVVLLWCCITFNRLVRLRNHCVEAWSNVDTELKRRYNLIPNLVDTVKGYAAHERQVLTEVTRLRQEAAANVGSPKQQAGTENQFVQALDRLLARVEAYPELCASANFLALQRELANTEDRIQAARRFYNGNVREHNNLVEGFPSMLIARIFGFAPREFFEVQDLRIRTAPAVWIS